MSSWNFSAAKAALSSVDDAPARPAGFGNNFAGLGDKSASFGNRSSGFGDNSAGADDPAAAGDGGGDSFGDGDGDGFGFSAGAPAADNNPAHVGHQPFHHDYTSEEVAQHGWNRSAGYDYSRYVSQGVAAAEGVAARDGAAEGGGAAEGAEPAYSQTEWGFNAARYEWHGEYGDIGPEHPQLEMILFEGGEHVKAGQALEHLNTAFEVVQEGPIRIKFVKEFDDAGLHPQMRRNVELAGYIKPTVIQQYLIPAIMSGHDVVACAQTGSGKTAAYLIPILSNLMGKAKKLTAPRPNPAGFREGIDAPVIAEPLVLIVCPSRELAVQTFNEVRRFSYRSMLRPCVIYGGGPSVEQVRQLQKGCDILIGTPGRLCDFIGKPHILLLRRLKYMVIDEADELLSPDWAEELEKIMSGGDQQEGNITYLMFSATFPKVARDMAKKHLDHNHVRIRVGRAGSMHHNVLQTVVWVLPEFKRKAVTDILMTMPPARTIVFVNSKHAADDLDDYLYNLGMPCTSIHAGRTQLEREDALRAFRKGLKPILIATGVSARGLDVHNVMHVINYDLPAAQHGGLEEYTHRIGRTARIGNKGVATSFYNDHDESLATELTHFLQECNQNVPEFLEPYKAKDGEKIVFDADSGDELDAEADADGETETGGGW